MNLQQMIQWMNDPVSLGKDAGAELDAVLQQFPYFQTAHLLYIKSLHNENNFLYNNQLRVAAAYSTNRKVLYELITKKAAAEVEEKVIAEEKKIEKEIPKEILQPEFPKKKFTQDPDEWESGMMRQLQLLHHWQMTPQQILDQRIEEIKAEKEKATEKNIPVEKNPSAADEINTLLYVLVEPGESEDIGTTTDEIAEPDTSWEIKTLDTIAEESEKDNPIPQDPVQQEIIREAITSSIELEVDDSLPSLEEITGKSKTIDEDAEEIPVFVHKKKTPFIIPSEKNAEKPPVNEEKKEEEILPAGEFTFGNWLHQLNAEKISVPEEKTAEHDEQLIEKFIQNQPKIKAKKNEFYNPVNYARKSVQDSDEFLTETLARIYAKQGNIPKAIRAYQKLSLKYPEKTVYFAALIEELKRTPSP
ncbi:MAG: hypothetical protein HY064_16850 [Bacteroidetes bacterium]|nr:hypothetical protein [Bacteroidota bacterium]